MNALGQSFGLGCWGLGSASYGNVDEAAARQLIQCAVDEGITFFDTAPLYGDGLSEERLGRYLPKGQTFKIATKVGIVSDARRIIKKNLDPKYIVDSVESSLRRLRTESVYLLQLHSPEFQFESEELFETLGNLRESGKVRKIGISLKSPDLLPLHEKLFKWESYQYNCSIFDQRISVYKDSVQTKINSGIRMIARTPLNFGFLGNAAPDIDRLPENHHLRNWSSIQLHEWSERRLLVLQILKDSSFSLLGAALRFPIDSGLASIIIPGATNKEELLENLRSSESPLPPSIVQLLSNQVLSPTDVKSPYSVKS